MLLDRIYLRNYRVFEQELDLQLPPGLVGIFGPNGAGKSTLLEAVLWALWGKSRTSKEDVRSAGSHGDSVAEITFEHEGHIYLVRRTITGAGSTVRAQAHCDGLAMAEGVRDTGRYVHSVLGMDDSAFRASVFTEQKQLDAFSSQGPADRRKLVLSLLGVTPLDAARDKARADARQTAGEHSRLRQMLPDLGLARVSAADADARASALELAAGEQQVAAEASGVVAEAKLGNFTALDETRQRHEVLVVEGRSVRTELDAATAAVQELNDELAALAGAHDALTGLQPRVELLPAAESTVRLLAAVVDAAKEIAASPELPPPPGADEAALEAASQRALEARARLGSAQATQQSAAAQVTRAQEAFGRSASLSHEEDCPLCGQSLGQAFAKVQSHRLNDLEAAELLLAGADKDLAEANDLAQAGTKALRELTAQVAVARQARSHWENAEARHTQARQKMDAALTALAAHDRAVAIELGLAPASSTVLAALGQAQAAVAACRQAAEEANRLQGRLERRPLAEHTLAQARQRLVRLSESVQALRGQVKELGFDPDRLALARQELSEARAVAAEADKRAHQLRLDAARARTAADGELKRLSDAQAQHDLLAELESSSVHLSRAAELLNGFRNTVVASVGPRLAVQAAELFGELTDNEYDRLEVDPETYGLRICDSGIAYDLERFSGSEIDLANLAMRVAISEHVRFQSGGTVGLLVLDEIFGPLDEERRARMLLALERLRARFRQILVVTHSIEIKEQLPNAIEVIKKPGRRATARVIGY